MAPGAAGGNVDTRRRPQAPCGSAVSLCAGISPVLTDAPEQSRVRCQVMSDGEPKHTMMKNAMMMMMKKSVASPG